MIGIGGAPTRASILPEEPSERKKFPVASGVLDYFPDALSVLANVSWAGNEQHNPGQPLHWARGKSMDEADTMIRHFLQRGTLDKDGIRHTAKMAWRALALLQKELEDEQLAKELKRIDEAVEEWIGPGTVVKVMDDHHENYMPAKKMGAEAAINATTKASDFGYR